MSGRNCSPTSRAVAGKFRIGGHRRLASGRTEIIAWFDLRADGEEPFMRHRDILEQEARE